MMKTDLKQDSADIRFCIELRFSYIIDSKLMLLGHRGSQQTRTHWTNIWVFLSIQQEHFQRYFTSSLDYKTILWSVRHKPKAASTQTFWPCCFQETTRKKMHILFTLCSQY